jgi:hypothetical protein
MKKHVNLPIKVYRKQFGKKFQFFRKNNKKILFEIVPGNN